MTKTYTMDEARTKMEHFCAYQDRYHAEVVTKLRGMGMIAEAIDHIMVSLIQNGYVNEERYARSFTRGKHRIKGWGIPRIERELKAKGLSGAAIRSGLSEIVEEDYASEFQRQAEKKWNELSGEEVLKRKRKTADFLLRKGYEPDRVYDLIARLARD